MKTHSTVERGNGRVMRWDDVFPAAPDGKRHPTAEEIVKELSYTYRSALDGTERYIIQGNVRLLLERLATVAPKEE